MPSFNRDLHPIGKAAIRSVGLKLPIFKGYQTRISVRGRHDESRSKMGEGNYALAGHYMTNQGILFSPLKM